MIIDIHTHTFPEKIAAKAIDKLSHAAHIVPFSDGTLAKLIENEQNAGVDLAVVQPVATAPHQVVHINDAAIRTTENYGKKGVISFGGIHPDFQDYRKELARIHEHGLKGIKVHPVYQGIDIDDIRFLRIFDRAAELGLTVMTHGGLDVGFPGVVHCSPKMIRHVMTEIGTGSFSMIAAHMGGWKNWQEVPDLLSGTGIYLDTSFATGSMHPLNDGYYQKEDLKMLDSSRFITLLDAIGTDHVLFGTDSPWSAPEEGIAFIRNLPVSPDIQRRILGDSAARLLRLDAEVPQL